MRPLLFLCLLSSTAAFLPQAHVGIGVRSNGAVLVSPLAAEGRNASEVSKENVGDYRESVPVSRTEQKKLAEVRRIPSCHACDTNPLLSSFVPYRTQV